MELRNFIGAILNHLAVIELFAEIAVNCEVKTDEDIYVKSFTLKAIVRCIFKYAHFPKPGILFRSSECLKLLRKKSLQKHLTNGICWKGKAYNPAFSCFTE